MKNRVLEDIKNYAARRLQQEYGYCGIADGPNIALINSGDDEDITIKIECVPSTTSPTDESTANMR